MSEENKYTFENKEYRDTYRHTVSHILAQAVKRLYPEARFAYGPATEKGFYYDVDLGDKKLSDEDLPAIEAEMAKIVKENLPIKPFVLSREDAVKLMEERGEIYKVEHIGDLPEDAVLSFYQQGEFVDLCAGPHLMSTKEVGKAFKIMSLAVDQSRRRQGLGERLLRHAEQEMRQLGMTKFCGETRASNHAMQWLFTRCGYRLEWVEENYYNHPDESTYKYILQ